MTASSAAAAPAGRAPALLAFDTATEAASVALAVGGRIWTHRGAGGAQASTTLVPAVFGLLAQAGATLRDLDAIAFGRGPGAFTGLRTACSVAQGLAFGSGRPVLPIDTLLVVAAASRAGDGDGTDGGLVWAVMDARMDQIYAASYRHAGGAWHEVDAPLLADADALNRRWRATPPERVAGNALVVFGDRLETGAAVRDAQALPDAAAMLPLAAALWRRGGAVDPAEALPLYLRDKVAQTSAERAAARAAKEGAAPGAQADGGASRTGAGR